MRVNGKVVEATGAASNPLLALPLSFSQGYLGRSSSSFEKPASISLHEVAVMVGAVPDAELAAISAELAAKWGLLQDPGEPLPPTHPPAHSAEPRMHPLRKGPAASKPVNDRSLRFAASLGDSFTSILWQARVRSWTHARCTCYMQRFS